MGDEGIPRQLAPRRQNAQRPDPRRARLLVDRRVAGERDEFPRVAAGGLREQAIHVLRHIVAGEIEALLTRQTNKREQPRREFRAVRPGRTQRLLRDLR